jgi:hypothetical protein
MAWDVFSSIEKYCKTTHGYNGLKNVDAPDQGFAGVMPSYFLAETLKYFLLLFGPDDYLLLDNFIFTTEAHPLRRGIDEGSCPVDRHTDMTLPTPWLIISIVLVILAATVSCGVAAFFGCCRRKSKKLNGKSNT